MEAKHHTLLKEGDRGYQTILLGLGINRTESHQEVGNTRTIKECMNERLKKRVETNYKKEEEIVPIRKI